MFLPIYMAMLWRMCTILSGKKQSGCIHLKNSYFQNTKYWDLFIIFSFSLRVSMCILNHYFSNYDEILHVILKSSFLKRESVLKPKVLYHQLAFLSKCQVKVFEIESSVPSLAFGLTWTTFF